MDSERREILLKEYEICQKENDSSSRNYWTTFGLFTGLSTAVMGGAIALGAKNESALPVEIWLGLIIIFGLIVFVVLCFLQSWLVRVNHFLGVHNRRIREIEAELGMERNIRIWIIDHWDDLRDKNKTPDLENLKIKDENVIKYMKALSEHFEFISPEDKEKMNKLEISIPRRYQPPRTGIIIIGQLFKPLLAFWAVFLLVIVGTLISRVL